MTVQAATGAYEVHLLETVAAMADRLPQGHRVWLVDARVWALYGRELRTLAGGDDVVPVPIEEARKTLDTAQELCAALMARGVRRRTTLVAVGGGILQDLAGFAASILYRGIPWVFVPTTLLAQADSCIGGKTSLNFQAFKNLLGTFWPPRRVLLAPAFLGTLDAPDYFSGLGEVLKLHLMGGEGSLEAYEGLEAGLRDRDGAALREAIPAALAIKRGYIERDEHDAGPRLLLNYGHCFGHALEAVTGYRWPHGQAVVLGMRLANRVAERRGLLAPDLARRAERLFRGALTLRPQPADLEAGPLLAAMGRDKKRTGEGLALIVMRTGLAFAQVQDLAPEEVEAALEAERRHD